MDGVCLHDKNCPAFAGIPVERTGILLCWDGEKNVPVNIFFHIYMGNYTYTCMREIHAWRFFSWGAQMANAVSALLFTTEFQVKPGRTGL